MTDLHELYDDALRQQVEEAEAAEAASDRDEQTNRPAQVNAHELAAARSDLRANELAGRTIGPWTVIGYKKNASGRNVYVIRHRDGFLKGVRGYRLNAMLAAARRDGVTVR